MAAIKRMAAVMMMTALLGGPVAAPGQRPDRGRRRPNPWRSLMSWLGRRRPGAGGKQ